MKSIDPNFPSYFLIIDGEIFRNECIIYKKIMDCIHSFKNIIVKGFTNLVSSGLNLSIFDSNYVKENINYYLLFLRDNKYIKLNLYVPETLSSCISIFCNFTYKKYVNITCDNNWIGIMIWQHKFGGSSCSYGTKYGIQYECKGCTESGKEREIDDGKKYSNNAWYNSYRNGKNAVMNAPNYRLIIHNSGIHGNWSVFKDYSNKSLTIDQIKLLENNLLKYINKTNSSSSNYFGGKYNYKKTKKNTNN
jgi:hypothetical protein